jgi:hypothetical protein
MKSNDLHRTPTNQHVERDPTTGRWHYTAEVPPEIRYRRTTYGGRPLNGELRALALGKYDARWCGLELRTFPTAVDALGTLHAEWENVT